MKTKTSTIIINMNSKIENLQALHNLFTQGAISIDEYDFLKKEIIAQESDKHTKIKDPDVIGIPDKNFQVFLSENHNVKILNDTVKYDDIKDITSIKCEFSNINDLSGIEYFTELVHLDCSFNEIDYLDISRNHKLCELHVVRNQIEEIDLSNNPSLILFSANHNCLYDLDISKNPNLKVLFCSNNYLESIMFGEVLPEKIHLMGNPGNWWQKFQSIK